MGDSTTTILNIYILILLVEKAPVREIPENPFENAAGEKNPDMILL